MYAHKGHRIFREDYFGYLSRYAQNLVTYSEPTRIDVELGDQVFQKLFEKFIFKFPLTVKHTIKPIEKARKILSKSVAEVVNFDVE